jgi:hypothetical protein
VIRLDHTVKLRDLEKVLDYALKIPIGYNLYVSNREMYSWLIEKVQFLEDKFNENGM